MISWENPVTTPEVLRPIFPLKKNHICAIYDTYMYHICICATYM